MENAEAKTAEVVSYNFKEVRKAIAEKLDHALTDQKIILGTKKLEKHIKKLSKTLAEEIVKTVKKIEKPKKGKVKKEKVKKEKVSKKTAKKK